MNKEDRKEYLRLRAMEIGSQHEEIITSGCVNHLVEKAKDGMEGFGPLLQHAIGELLANVFDGLKNQGFDITDSDEIAALELVGKSYEDEENDGLKALRQMLLINVTALQVTDQLLTKLREDHDENNNDEEGDTTPRGGIIFN